MNNENDEGFASLEHIFKINKLIYTSIYKPNQVCS